VREDEGHSVVKHDKVMEKILLGVSDANIAFKGLRGLLLHLCFEERTRGAHHVYRKGGIEEKINIQRARKQG